ncbi:MAG TPA: amidohydrolase family protein [Candidatus Eisenbacteria bacterium]|jgi:imidazolonepropionase-like amidohydrolase
MTRSVGYAWFDRLLRRTAALAPWSPTLALLVAACPFLLAAAAPAADLARVAPAAPAADSNRLAAELAAARRVFQANLDAIRRRDRDAYLACYLNAPTLARTGSQGFTLSYDSLAASAGSGWPDLFEGLDLRLTPIQPGLVYGTYRYRVRYAAEEQRGLSERLFLRTDQGWKIAMTSAFPALPGVPAPPRAIVGGALIDGTGRAAVRNAVVILRDGKIEALGPPSRVRVPAGVDTLDARGCWVLPGLVDSHVHFSQTGWADGRPDGLDLRPIHPYEETERRLREHPEVFQRAWLASGVTAVFDVGGYPWTVAMAHAAESNWEAPHIAAAGPLLSTVDHWLNLPAERQFIHLHDSTSAVEGVRYLKALGVAAVKVWFIVRPGSDFQAMERAVHVAGEEARRAGLPLIVHATGLREAKAALKAGAKLLVHSVDDHLVDAEFLTLAKRNGTLYCPTLTVRDGGRRMADAVLDGNAPTLDDPNGAVDSLTRALVAATSAEARRAGATARRYRATRMDSLRAMMAANLRAVRRAGIPIALGTDAGNPLTLHGSAVYAEMEAMERAGLTPAEVIVASTRNAARAMGRGADLGTLEVGKAADLLIVGADPTRAVANLRALRWVVRGGVVRSRDEMREAVAKTRW